MIPPLRGNPWLNLGRIPRTPSIIWRYLWEKLAHGGHPKPTSARTHQGGRRVCSTSCTGREARGVTLRPHTPTTLTPTPIPTQAPNPPSYTFKGVYQPRGHQLTHVCTSRTRVGSDGAIGSRRLCLCSRAAGSGGGGIGSVPTHPFIHCTLGEGSSALATPLLICMQGDMRCRTTFHLGGGGPREGAHGASCHPQPDLVEGAPLLPSGLWGEGALQRFPTPPSVCQERVTLEPLPGPSILWGGSSRLGRPARAWSRH